MLFWWKRCDNSNFIVRILQTYPRPSLQKGEIMHKELWIWNPNLFPRHTAQRKHQYTHLLQFAPAWKLQALLANRFLHTEEAVLAENGQQVAPKSVFFPFKSGSRPLRGPQSGHLSRRHLVDYFSPLFNNCFAYCLCFYFSHFVNPY